MTSTSSHVEMVLATSNRTLTNNIWARSNVWVNYGNNRAINIGIC